LIKRNPQRNPLIIKGLNQKLEKKKEKKERSHYNWADPARPIEPIERGAALIFFLLLPYVTTMAVPFSFPPPINSSDLFSSTPTRKTFRILWSFRSGY
jgi:hypothetical protein